MLRPHFETLCDRDEADAGRAKAAKIRKEIERRTAPTIEALHEHDVDRPALGSVEDAIETRANAATTRRRLLDLERDAHSTRGSGGAQLGAGEPRILLAGAHSVVERGAEPAMGMTGHAPHEQSARASSRPRPLRDGGRVTLHVDVPAVLACEVLREERAQRFTAKHARRGACAR